MYYQKKLQKFAQVLSIDECKRALMTMESNKTLGTDGLTAEFYHFLSYFFVKEIPLSRRVGYIMDGSMDE